jgi:hypothetical protein
MDLMRISDLYNERDSRKMRPELSAHAQEQEAPS